MNMLHSLPQIVTAIGGLGTAAFGIVDATKVFNGGVNHIGFKVIRYQISALVPAVTVKTLPLSGVLQTLQQNWFNGTDLASQKAIAKSLIKLSFNPSTATMMTAVTTVDGSDGRQ